MQIKNSAAIKDASYPMLQSQIQLGHEEYDWNNNNIEQHYKWFQANNYSGKIIEKLCCIENIDGSIARDLQWNTLV